MTTHPRAIDLDRYAVRDLAPAEAARIRGHLEECPRCDQAIRAFQAQDAERMTRVPPATFVARLEERRGRGRSRFGLGLAAAVVAGGALAAAGWLLLPGTATTRYKGGGLVLHVRRGQQIARLDSEHIRAGDALRVTLTVSAPTRAQVWFLDARGRVDRLLPEPIDIGAGEQVLPGAVEVEAPCVDLQVVAATGAAASLATEAELRRTGRPPAGTDVRRLRCQ
jgi:hypothetical protein